jgi:NADH-quinone oxidoreductase subunit N
MFYISQTDYLYTTNSANYINFTSKLNGLVSLFYENCENNFDFLHILHAEVNNILSLHFLFYLPECFILFTLFFLIVQSVYSYESNYYLQKPKKNNYEFALLHVMLSNFLVNFFAICLHLFSLSYKNYFLFNSLLSFDFFTTTTKIIILIGSNIFLIFATLCWVVLTYPNSLKKYEYPFLISFSILSICLLISSVDFIMLYLSLESLSFCLYILVVFKIKDKLTIEAGLKYFCLGSLASGFVLFGISLMYSVLNTVSFIKLKYLLEFSNSSASIMHIYVYLGFIFLFVGFLFKLGVFPYHMGLLDVYEGSSLIITIYLISVVKFTIIVVVTKLLMNTFYALQFIWSPLLGILSVMAMIYGSVAALYQQRLKRFFAYSSIHQVGYILLSLSTGTFEGLNACLFYALLYKISSICFLGIVLLINVKIEIDSLIFKKRKSLVYFSDLIFYTKKEPLLVILFSITLFSLANLPPFAGFFAKYLIFKSALNSSYPLIFSLAFVGILTSVISSFYYLRLFKLLTFNFNLENYLAYENNSGNDTENSVYDFSKTFLYYTPYLKLKPLQSYFCIACDLGFLYKLNKIVNLLIYLVEFTLIFFAIIIASFIFFFSNVYIFCEILTLSCLIPLSLQEYLYHV